MRQVGAAEQTYFSIQGKIPRERLDGLQIGAALLSGKKGMKNENEEFECPI